MGTRKTAALLKVRGPGGSDPIPLDKPVMVIGRGHGADIVLPVPEVSGRHAEIIETDGTYFLRDLDSKNGTYLEEELIGDFPVSLEEGSMIVLGNGAVEFRVSLSLTRIQPWLRVDRSQGDIWVNGRRVDLSQSEFDLVEMLDRSDGGRVSKDDLLKKLWPGAHSDSSLTSCVYKVNKKIDPSGGRKAVVNERRRGYRLNI